MSDFSKGRIYCFICRFCNPFPHSTFIILIIYLSKNLAYYNQTFERLKFWPGSEEEEEEGGGGAGGEGGGGDGGGGGGDNSNICRESYPASIK